MFVTSLTERELDTVILALRYWRHQRRDSRRADDLLTREETDLLLSKLATGTLSSLPDDEFRSGVYPQ